MSAKRHESRVEPDFGMPAHVGVHTVESRDGGHLADGVEDVADAARSPAHVVQVLAVAPRPIKPHLVKASATTKNKLVAEQGMAGNLDDQPRQNQILKEADVVGVPEVLRQLMDEVTRRRCARVPVLRPNRHPAALGHRDHLARLAGVLKTGWH